MRKLVLGSAALAGLGVLAFANHVDVGLSYFHGSQVLSKVNLVFDGTGVGVPPYAVSYAQVGDTFSVTDGEQFSVTDQDGVSEVVTISGGALGDLSQVAAADLMEHINAQLTIAEVELDNGFLSFHGMTGGALTLLTIADVQGAPLEDLNLAGGSISGAKNVQMVVSVPEGEGSDAHHAPSPLGGFPYLVLASATEGALPLGPGVELPLFVDEWTTPFVQAAASGALPGFVGTLDEYGDSQAILVSGLLPAAGMPEALHFAFVVADPETGALVYASNRFSVNLVQP